MAAHVVVCEIYVAIFCSIPDTELIPVQSTTAQCQKYIFYSIEALVLIVND